MRQRVRPGLPWTTGPDSVTWTDAEERSRVVFDEDGIRQWRDGDVVAGYPWARIRELTIRVPYLPRRLAVGMGVLDTVGPMPFESSSTEVEIGFAARYDVVRWSLASPARYDWRLQFVLDDLLELLHQDFSPLGTAGVLDGVAQQVVPRVPRRARFLLYTDLLGLDRFLGGHGAIDDELRSVLRKHGVGCEARLRALSRRRPRSPRG